MTKEYDIVLVLEVLEHVPDVQGFLGQLNKVRASEYVITVPDACSCFSAHFEHLPDQNILVGFAHPSHSFWYAPCIFSKALKNIRTGGGTGRGFSTEFHCRPC